MLFLRAMNFLFPTFLIGLAAIAIPIIIHLFNFRKYKKVYFTNVQFLKELQQESYSKSKLKEWLILAMRILAIACLVFAFAQPFIPGKVKTSQGEKAISIYIDNSFSMESTNKKGTLLENAKQYATEIANTFNASDKFQLLTNDFEGKHQRLISKEEFIEQLNEVKISSATKSINDVIKRQQDFLQNSSSKNKRIFLLSDFQKNTSLISKSDIDTSTTISFIPISSSEVNNVYIDSVWFETPVQQFETQQIIHATIINKSNKDIENGSLKLYINDTQVSLASFDVTAGNKKDVSISFTVKIKGINKGVLKIEDYPITYDDNFYFSFNAEATIKALVINGKDTKTAGNFRSLMQDDSLFIYKENNESSIDYSLFTNTNIIVLNELSSLTSGLTSELQKFVSKGGSVVIFPNKKADLESYNGSFKNIQLPQLVKLDTTNTKTQSINFEQGLYEGVFDKIDQRMDLPKVNEHFEFAKTTNSTSQNLVLLQNGQFLVSLNPLGSGKIYLFSIPSDETSSNLLKHALFVPTMIKMSILSLKPSPTYYKTATNEAISLNNTSNFSDKPFHIIKDDKILDVIPEHRLLNNATILFTQNQITEAGQYAVIEDTSIIKDLAFNYDRKESDMKFMSEEELQKQIDDSGLKNMSILMPDEKILTSALQETNDGKKLWKLFLILAMVFLAAEILIIRLFKN
ncbi:MAG: BatA and WFA domain-containing protein [Bacteroidia bacterium]|nr:BatA and WFA domain-containing protein [Bacteroidia bacterium]